MARTVLARPERDRQDVPHRATAPGRRIRDRRRVGGPQGHGRSARRRRRSSRCRALSSRAVQRRSSRARAATPARCCATCGASCSRSSRTSSSSTTRRWSRRWRDAVAGARRARWLVSGVGVVAMLLAADRAVRRDRLFGGAPHARDRHPHGARARGPERSSRMVMRQGWSSPRAGARRRRRRGGRWRPLAAARMIAGVLYGVGIADPFSWGVRRRRAARGLGAGEPHPRVARLARRSVGSAPHRIAPSVENFAARF